MDFPNGSDGKESAYNAGGMGLIPGSGISPGEGNGNLLWWSCLENLIDRGAWQATVSGIAKRQTWLSEHTHTDFINAVKQMSSCTIYEYVPLQVEYEYFLHLFKPAKWAISVSLTIFKSNSLWNFVMNHAFSISPFVLHLWIWHYLPLSKAKQTSLGLERCIWKDEEWFCSFWQTL